MALPNFQEIMLPLLKFAGDQKEHSFREAVEHIANLFKVSEEERSEVLPSGQYILDNRVGWARTYLKKSGLLETTKRSYFKITELGLQLLQENPQKIDIHFLKRFPQFREFVEASKDRRNRKEDVIGELEVEENLPETPQELMEKAYQKIRNELASELLNLVKKVSPHFFERLVVELLLKMGYGGSLRDAGKAIGRTRDGGIDGIIKEDKLGLDAIYI